MPSRRRAFVDASEQTFDRFPGRASAEIGTSVLSEEPANRVPEERKVVLWQSSNPGLGLVHRQPQSRHQRLHLASWLPRHCRGDSRSRSHQHN